MSVRTSFYANRLRQELALRNRYYARGRVHVESYGSSPVIVYAPESGRHGNFFDASYKAVAERPEWVRRFDKIHAQAGRSLPRAERRWRELDSSMSSDALLMNIFCAPGAVESKLLRDMLGVEAGHVPLFGWRARVPLANGHFDRTEVDMRLGSLLVEAKLTEADFQAREAAIVESYRDFDAVFARELLPQFKLPPKRRKEASEFPENYSQELESLVDGSESHLAQNHARAAAELPHVSVAGEEAHSHGRLGYASYQLIRNVLAAYAQQCSFCVFHDARRQNLREDWFQVMAAVKSAEMRVRLKVATWQELAAFLPDDLQMFLDCKYGIVAPGRAASPIDDVIAAE
ncbi:MAG: PGN_0703 family putative restriction endonuclease [Terracidiphilus sp.]